MVFGTHNSIDLAILALAANYVGVPVMPVSPSYSLMSHDFRGAAGTFPGRPRIRSKF
jgi:feruloyl-CoA synthase